MCDAALKKYGVTEQSRKNFFSHPDVKGWEDCFLASQVLQFVSGIRDVRLHDITCSTLRFERFDPEEYDEETWNLIQASRNLKCP
jgi:hypothetical protein